MNQPSNCPNCGVKLPQDSTEELCPKCLLQAGLEQSTQNASQGTEDVTLASPSPQTADGPTIPSHGDKAGMLGAGAKIRYFGDYELLEEIARGGMGVVYKARQTSLNRIVALKMILSGHLASDEDVKRFHAEAEAAAQLDHPGIVPIYEVGEHEGQHYFSMGYVDGGSLADRLKNGPLPPREAAEFVLKIAEAIAYAHGHGVIHRDLKPGNVLLDENGEPKLTDFGLAKRVEGGSDLTATGQILGTPSYMPPEQATGDTSKVTESADVYALGAVLYAFLTGRPPFQADNPIDTVMQVLEREPVPVRQLAPQVPQDLETVSLRCLEKDISRRYASAQDLFAELQRFLRGEPIQARPISGAARAWRWCKRQPVVAGMIAGIAASLIGGATVATYFAVQASQEAAVARKEETRADENADIAIENEKAAKLNEAKAIKESEKAARQLRRSEWLLYASQIKRAQMEWERGNPTRAMAALDDCRWDLRGWEHDYLYTRFTRGVTTISGRDSGVISLAFRGVDENIIATDSSATTVWDSETAEEVDQFEVYGGFLKLCQASASHLVAAVRENVRFFDATNGNQLWSLKFAARVRGVATRGDKATVVVGGESGVWDAAGVKLVALEPSEGLRGPASMSDRGDIIAATRYGDGGAHLVVWDGQTGKFLHQIAAHPDEDEVTALSVSPDGSLIASSDWGDRLRVWDAKTGDEFHTFNVPAVQSLCFRSDGRQLVAGTYDGRVVLLDLIHKRKVSSFKAQHSESVDSVVYSPDDRRIVSADGVGTIKIWDLTKDEEAPLSADELGLTFLSDMSRDGTRVIGLRQGHTVVLETVTGREITRLPQGLTMARFTSGDRLVQASSKHTKPVLRLWDPSNGPQRITIALSSKPEHITISPNGGRIAVVLDGSITIYDTENGAALELDGQGGPWQESQFSRDSKYLVAMGGAQRKTLAIWSVDDGTQRHVLRSEDRIDLFTFGQNEQMIIYRVSQRDSHGDPDGDLVIWDAAKDSAVSRYRLEDATGLWVAVVTSDGKRMAIGGPRSDIVRVIDVASGEDQVKIEVPRVRSLALHPNGNEIAGSTWNEVIRWDATSGAELARINLQLRQIYYTPDGNITGTGISGKTIQTWDVATNDVSLTFRMHDDGDELIVSPNAQFVTTLDKKKENSVYDAESGELLCTLDDTDHVIVGLDGRTAVGWCGDGQIGVWDLHNKALLRRLPADRLGTKLHSVSHDGSKLIVSNSLGRIQVLELSDGALRHLPGHAGGVFAAVFSPDDQRVASAGFDQTVRLWDLDTGAEMALEGHVDAAVFDVNFSPDGRQLVSCTKQGIRVWDASFGQQTLALEQGAAQVWFRSDGKQVIARSWELVRTLDARNRDKTLTLSGHSDPVVSVACTPDGRRYASGSMGGTIKLWDAETGRLLITRRGHDEVGSDYRFPDVASIDFSPNGERVATGGGDGIIKLWDAQFGEELARFELETNQATIVRFSPDGRWLIAGANDKSLRVWDLEAGTLEHRWRVGSGGARNITFGPSGQIIVCSKERAKAWDISSGELFEIDILQRNNELDPVVGDIFYRADANELLSVDSNGTLRLHNVQTGELIKTTQGKGKGFNSVSFSPDCRWFISATKSIRIHDANTGEEVARVDNQNYVLSATFDPRGKRVVFAEGKTVRVWPLPPNLGINGGNHQ